MLSLEPAIFRALLTRVTLGKRRVIAHTIYIELRQKTNQFLRGGIAFYQLAADSATVQLYYVFHTKWYMPWDKMAQIANDAKYGDHLDSALQRLKKNGGRKIINRFAGH